MAEMNVLHSKKEFYRVCSTFRKDSHYEKDQYQERKDYRDKTSSAIATFRHKASHEKITIRYEKEKK